MIPSDPSFNRPHTLVSIKSIGYRVCSVTRVRPLAEHHSEGQVVILDLDLLDEGGEYFLLACTLLVTAYFSRLR